ncbi:MAG: transposase [Acidobacteria bacterium]|nr:transposase [Acidobacteriota bacterium]
MREIQAFLAEMYAVEVSPDFISSAPRPVYTAASAEAAAAALDAFEQGPWGRRYPAVVASWRRAWAHVIPFLAFPPAIRRGHVLMENRHGLVVQARATQATGTAERDAAIEMLRAQGAGPGCTVGADKNYDTHGCVADVRALGVTPHVSQNLKRNGGSAIDGRTTRHEGYAVSQACRPRVERVFEWIKPIAGLRTITLRGLAHVEWLFVFACAAFNVTRLVNLRAGGAA